MHINLNNTSRRLGISCSTPLMPATNNKQLITYLKPLSKMGKKKKSNVWAPKAKPWNTSLLKIIRDGIKMYPTKVAGIDMHAINCSISRKTSIPQQTLFAGHIQNAKTIVRDYRLRAAKEIHTGKIIEEQTEIKV